MRVTDAIKSTAELTGNVVSEATLCRWLSELDGQLMFDFYKGDAFIGYTWDADENAELLVPFPWDGMYINYLEAMVYYSNGEYDRYQNAITQYNKKIDDYRKWLTRKAVPINPALLQGRPIGGTPTTVNFVGKNDTPWYFLSAYALAVKHGYAGTETEWLEAIKGLSAYEVALENGFEGTEEKWLASLVGPQGERGEQGPPGEKGEKGEKGETGATGATGPAGGVNSFNGRQGDVKPKKGDYSYEDVGAAAAKHAAQHAKDSADPLTLAMLGLKASEQRIDEAVSIYPSNPNLLDNWYFGNPVDQRGGYVVPPGTNYYVHTLPEVVGQTAGYVKVDAFIDNGATAQITVNGTSYVTFASDAVRGYTGAGYTIDRWAIEGAANASLNIVEGGIELVNGGGANEICRQRVNGGLAGEQVTFSLLVTRMTGAAFFAIGNQPLHLGLNTQTFTVNANGIPTTYFWIPNSGGSITVAAAKLELGSQQTLAHQENGNWVLNEIPDYGEQLAKCQRYFCFARYRGRAPLVTANGVQIDVPTPVTMRATPTVVGSFGVMNTGGVDVDGFTIAQCETLSTSVRLALSKSSHGLADASVWFGEDAYFDANL